jgi:NADH-quinone oxidoreductase subunit J
MIIDLLLGVLLVAAALTAVMDKNLIRAAIALAIVSILLTLVMFQLQAPLAAVFELSVCAGLITVIFMSAISLTKPQTPEEARCAAKERLKRFWFLPILALLAGIGMVVVTLPLNFALPLPEIERDVRLVLWQVRQIDLFGQIVILLAGVFAVIVLFKDKPRSKADI